MSEAPEGGNNSGETPAAGEFTPITSQEDLNRIIGERVKRATAKFADYKDLQTKAARLDEIETANQTEVEKAQARIAELEAQMQSVEREALRRRIAGEHGITDADDIDLFLTGTDEETLSRQAKRLADRTASQRKQGNYVSREGTTTPPAAESDERAAVRTLFGTGG